MPQNDLRAAAGRDSALRAELLRVYPELAEDHAALIDTLDGLSDLDEAIVAVMRVALEREAYGEALKRMMADMKERAARFAVGAQKMRAAVAAVIAESGRTKPIVRPDMTISQRPAPTSYVVTDPDTLPDDLVAIERRPNMAEIARRMKAGELIEGVEKRNGAPFVVVLTR